MAENVKYLRLLQDYDKHCIRIDQATTIDIHEKPEDKLIRVKKLELNYLDWFEWYFPNFAKKKSSWFHLEMANDLIKNKVIRLLAEIYRSGGKSVHLDMGVPLYLYLVKNDLHFMLLIGKNETKAKQLLSGIQSQLQFNNRLKNDYGNKYQQGDWATGDFTTTDGVKFMSLGFGQDPRGSREQAERPDYIVVDDVDTKKHIRNDTMMREAVDYITEDVWGCFDAEDGGTERFAYANNNFHKNSITNRLKVYFNEVLAKRKEAPKPPKGASRKKVSPSGGDLEGATKFKVLTVCAVKDLTTFTPEWPEKTSAKYWKEKYEDIPYRSFLREYMHIHIEDGAIFKFDDIQYTEPLELKKYDALCLYGDLSYKAGGDYKALVLVGKTGKEFHIIRVFLRQTSRANAAIWLYDLYEDLKLQKFNIRYLIEGLFAMDEFISDFDNEGEKRGYFIPVVADKRGKTDKFDRIESIAGHFERRNVFFNDVRKDSDQQTLIDQFLAFEKGSQAHDDGPDATHGAFAYLNVRTHSKKTSYKVGFRESRKY